MARSVCVRLERKKSAAGWYEIFPFASLLLDFASGLLAIPSTRLLPLFLNNGHFVRLCATGLVEAKKGLGFATGRFLVSPSLGVLGCAN